ncbi:ABC transporter ATP-binding protein [candidate division WOR-1 bacterium RIFOXYA12_FULL_43_27]|uniref:ABC transporter ATP-binding protein n=1 Tax=candidate division WOR-1 bacterium RIFOXYC2_FULL_46_14 TaxID=1802587 RepID=A0A1F4UA12_UNCSA|nr:MAG: ABC transporter ATP-binding protein [candidate division WOR-1 bacterium RIFOXYA12_FULL_43_27]OGC20045.1 MAG: ABC transporter ATP-binding protein [candidate division WOR-1 bacterium RIFOXYB2_FULL_46_45]OGC32219.1 MAG: ABC transporter ATP-binding protein [candidate division WOR-1 bacterium RIFOXYA2_FULL_46_56]OGC41123.1 MAG: ABC transporter ATP-binding protein [candidate division WOR-1 bacterium RIFOXYC2_FULL_46_14]
MIKIKNLTKKFNHHFVIDGISLEIKEGEKLAVIGPSGCGKSTLLRLLIGLENPTGGEIEIDGKIVHKLEEEGLIKLRQGIGMVFQSSALFDSLTVGENVAFALREHTHKSEREIKEIVARKLELVDLSGKDDLMPSELSGGMQKRVSIARALAFDPKIILYDEPTTGLDPLTSITIEKLINKIAKETGATSVIVTHQVTTILRTATRIIMLDRGKLIDSDRPVVKQFLEAGKEI